MARVSNRAVRQAVALLRKKAKAETHDFMPIQFKNIPITFDAALSARKVYFLADRGIVTFPNNG